LFAEITPVLELDAKQTATLIAELKVDRIEVTPPIRLSLTKGLNRLEMRTFKIIRPAQGWPEGNKDAGNFHMDLKIYETPESFENDIREITVRLG
jgi:hypothetical protein